jgi:putative FmdB family regulatory protein
MPTYAYGCPKCGHEFQKFHKMNAKVRPRCPACGTAAERRITGGAGVHFKGSGFYVTDYKKGADKADGPAKTEKTDKTDKTDATEKGGGSASAASRTRKPDSGAKGADS